VKSCAGRLHQVGVLAFNDFKTTDAEPMKTPPVGNLRVIWRPD